MRDDALAPNERAESPAVPQAALDRTGRVALFGKQRLAVRTYAARPLTHSHSFNQIILPLTGTLHLETGAWSRDVTTRNVAIISADIEHAFSAMGDNRFIVIDVQGEAAIWQAARKQGVFQSDASIRGLLEFARSSPVWLYEDDGFRTNLGNLFLYSLTGIIQEKEAHEPRALLAATEFMRLRFGERISIQDIAEAANVSEASLHRLFAIWCNISPAKHLSRLRLEHAQTLLSSSRKSIAQIAVDCGFSEQSALTRAMVRETGTTPAVYRNLSRPHL